jgi:hypothetical protein
MLAAHMLISEAEKDGISKTNPRQTTMRLILQEFKNNPRQCSQRHIARV